MAESSLVCIKYDQVLIWDGQRLFLFVPLHLNSRADSESTPVANETNCSMLVLIGDAELGCVLNSY